MEDVHELKKKVDHLEYEELKPLKEQMNEIKISLSNNDLLTKQVMESNTKLNNTMDILKDTMVEIGQSVKDSNRVTEQLTSTVKQLGDKITKVETSTKESIDSFSLKLDEIDDKSKIDLLVWLKNNWLGLFGIGGIIYTIVEKFIVK